MWQKTQISVVSVALKTPGPVTDRLCRVLAICARAIEAPPTRAQKTMIPLAYLIMGFTRQVFEYLDALVIGVGHVDMVIATDEDSPRQPELTRADPILTKG